MITTAATNARSFVYCTVYQSPNDSSNHFNDLDGHYHQWIYIVEGVLDTYPSTKVDNYTAKDKAVLTEGNLYDISHTKGKFVYAKPGNSGASMITFNPVPTTRNLKVEILKDTDSTTINPTGNTTIVCITGPIDINGKTLTSMQFAKLKETSTITLSANSVCAVVTE